MKNQKEEYKCSESCHWTVWCFCIIMEKCNL